MSPLIPNAHANGHRAFVSTADDLGSTLVRSGLVPFIIVEAGNIIAASPLLREMLGSTTPYHHVDGQSLGSIVAEADRPAISDFCASLLREGVRGEFQCHLLHADGSTVPVLLVGSAVMVERQRQLVLLVTDLTPWVGERRPGEGSTLLDAFDRSTGFPNRALLIDRMKIAMAAARRYRRRAALLCIDLEHLDALLGKLVPEAALEIQATVAETLRNCVRDCDTVARVGLREFVVLLPEIGQREDAGLSAARVVQAIATLFEANEDQRRICAAIGVAVYPTDGASPERLVLAAETAMQSMRGAAGGGFALADATSAELATISPLEIRPDFFVGVPEIDEEHRALVDSTNALVQGLRRGDAPSALEPGIRAVIGLLRSHFATEARHLGTSPYEGSVDLKTRNLRFVDELECILLHVNAQSVTLAVRHLYDWLVPHLLNLDHKLAA